MTPAREVEVLTDRLCEALARAAYARLLTVDEAVDVGQLLVALRDRVSPPRRGPWAVTRHHSVIARVWEVARECGGPVCIATVRQHLPEVRRGTIKNALDRLHHRGALIRTLSGRAYVYRVAP